MLQHWVPHPAEGGGQQLRGGGGGGGRGALEKMSEEVSQERPSRLGALLKLQLSYNLFHQMPDDQCLISIINILLRLDIGNTIHIYIGKTKS